MRCSGKNCDGYLKNARQDVYWCETCKKSWLIKELSYETFDEAAKYRSHIPLISYKGGF